MPDKFMTSSVVLGAFLEIKLNIIAVVDFDPGTGRRPVIMLENTESLQHLVRQYDAGAEFPRRGSPIRRAFCDFALVNYSEKEGRCCSPR
jgi:hypothetical protein